MMLFRRSFCIVALLLVSLWGFGQFEDVTSEWLDTFGSPGDENAGLTVFPTLSIPLGGRYEGMGTAYTAVIGDLGYIEANPAGSAELRGSSAGVYHHQWYADTSLEGVVFATRIGPLGLGGGVKFFHSTFTEYDDSGKRASTGYFLEGVAILNVALRIISLEKFGLSMGANAKGVYRYVPESLAPGQSAGAIPVDIGALIGMRLLDLSRQSRRNLTLGVALKNFGQKVYALGAPLPTELSAGIAYSPLPFLLLSGDIGFPFSLDQESFPAEQMYYAFGIDLAIAKFLSIRAGAKFKAKNPRFSIGAVVGIGQLNISTNYVVDLISGFSPLDTINVAATADFDNP